MGYIALAVTVFSIAYTTYTTIQARKDADRRKRDQEAAMDAAKGLQIPVEGQIINIPVVYGRAKVGGARVWHRVKSNCIAAYPYNDITRGMGPSVPPLDPLNAYYDTNPFVFTSEGDNRRLDSPVSSVPVNQLVIVKYSGRTGFEGQIATGYNLEIISDSSYDNTGGYNQSTTYRIDGIEVWDYSAETFTYNLNSVLTNNGGSFTATLQANLPLFTNATITLNQTPWFKDKSGNIQTNYSGVNYTVQSYNAATGAVSLTPVAGLYTNNYGNQVDAANLFSIADKPSFWEEARGSKNQALFWKQVICWEGIHAINHVEIENQDFREQGKVRDWDTRIHAFRNGNIVDPLIANNFFDQNESKFHNVAHATCVSWLNRDEPQFGSVPDVSFQVEGMRVYTIVKAINVVAYNVPSTGTNQEFITACYNILLGREPDPEGNTYWLDALNSGVSRTAVIVAFKASTEHIRKAETESSVYALSSTKTYTNNPAYCLLDYLLSSDYGKGLSLSQVDLESFYNAAQICGRRVQVNGAFEAPLAGETWREKARRGEKHYINLYECNLVLDTSKTVRENIEILLQSMGEADLVWSDGVYKLVLIYPQEYKSIFDTTSLCPLDLNNNPPFPNQFIGLQAYYDRGDVVQYPPGPVATDLYVSLIDHNTATPLDNAGALSPYWQRGTSIGIDYVDITDDHIILGEEIAQSWTATQNRFNHYTVKFYNEAKGFAEDSISWPPKYNGISGIVERSRDELRNATVNDAWYRSKYPDLAAANWQASAQQHYDEYGWSEGRLPYENANIIYAGNPVTNAVYQTFLDEDNGVFLETEQFQSGDTSIYHALSTAEGYVRLSRQSVKFSFSLTREFLQLEPGDIIKVTSTLLQVPGELLKITQIKSNSSGNLEIECEKYDCRYLAWNAKDTETVSDRNIYSNSHIKQVTGLKFLSYAEYVDTTVGNNSEFVTNCYRILLKREPDTAGLNFWISELSTGRLTRADVIANIRLSDEFKTLTATTTTVTTNGKLVWDPAKDTRVIGYQIKYTAGLPTTVTKGTPWTQLGSTTDSFFEVSNIPIGLYTATVVSTAASGETAPELDPKTGSRWPLVILAIGVDIDIETLAVDITNPIVILKQDPVTGNVVFTQHPNFDGKTTVILGDRDISNSRDATYEVVDEVNCALAIDNSSLDAARGTYRFTSLLDKSGTAKIKVSVGSRVVLKEITVMAGEGLLPPLDPKPPIPHNFEVDSAITTVFMSHDDPIGTWPVINGRLQNGGYKQTHWYMTPALSAPPFSEAYLIEKSALAFTSIPAEPGTLYQCWCAWEGNDGQLSLPAGPLTTMTGQDVQKLLDVLNDKITNSQLDNTLRGRIDLIDGPDTLPGSVAEQILELKEDTDSTIATSATYLRARMDSSVNKTFWQIAAPTKRGVDPETLANIPLQSGDTWYDTDDKNKRYRWNGTTWEVSLDGSIADVDARVTTVETAKIGYATKAGIAFDNNGAITNKAGVDAWNAAHPTDPAIWHQGIPFASAVKQVAINDGAESVILEERFTTQRDINNNLGGQYTVKIQTNTGGDKYISGFGLANETDEGGATYSQFLVNANNFAVGTPTATGVDEGYPFIVTTTTQIINGVTVPPGVYIQDAFIANGTITNAKIGNATITNAKISSLEADRITANKIDSRGLSIKDAQGNIILASGTALDWSNVGGTGKPADNATKNTITRSTTAPASPTNGDIWVDTGATPNIIKVRVLGAWQNSSNYTTNTNQLTDGANLGSTAIWTGVSGEGKPADNATRNSVYRQATAPSSGMTVNDIWFNTSTYATYYYDGSAWRLAGDRTSQNTAAGILNQGAFATLNKIPAATVSTYIADLAVDTLQIAGNAITIPSSQQSFDARYGNGGTQVISQLSYYLDYPGSSLVIFNGRQNYDYGNRNTGLSLYFDFVEVVPLNIAGAINDYANVSWSGAVGAGWHTVQIVWHGQDSSVRISNRTLSVLGTMK
jgi:hypothetical protein